MSHDQVRSTTHRRGSTSKRWSWILFTTSAEMWCAPPLERLEPVEVPASGGCDIEIRVGVVDRFGEVHLDPSQGVDHVPETVKVELHEVLNGNPEVLFDGRHQLARSLVESGIDLVGTLDPGVGDEQVAGNRENGHARNSGIEVKDHDDIAIDPVDAFRAQPVDGGLDGQGAARRR